MSIFKCKMCGGNIDVTDGITVVECEYCGTKQTVPEVNDEKKLNLYNRANRLRMSSEFDKAGAIYEQIIAEFPEEAEAYWGLCLCNYGIEYVDDPATGAKIPTVHRASFEKLRKDENCELALEYADLGARVVYQEQAKEIDRIMGEILSISSSEKPYDIFICYKETDRNGGRTPDSVIAQDIYDELTKKGYKVFFSRITLEDKLGQQYEPYIFAALNSAKLMLAIGTDYEYYNAVWVKNEWSRFIKLMAKDKSKVLIPCFKGMDAYDMPEGFKGLQSQDMSKLGFMQDLLRGIDKIFDREKKAEIERVVIREQRNNPTVESLLKRVFIFLKDEEWQSADEYCERVLDIEPENARAYLGKLMAYLKVHTEEVLKDLAQPFDNNKYYVKVCSLNSGLAEKLKADNDYIRERNETAKQQVIYDKGTELFGIAKSESEFKYAAAEFDKINGFKDADVLAKQCLEKAEICRKNDIYQSALRKMEENNADSFECAAESFKMIPSWKDADAFAKQCLEKAEIRRKDAVYASAKNKMTGERIASYEEAIEVFMTISGWKDAVEQIYACQKKIEGIKAKEESDRLKAARKAEEKRIADETAAKKRKKIIAIVTPITVTCIAFLIVLTTVIIPNGRYKNAVALMNNRKYSEAISAFEATNGYKDSADRITECKYNNAVSLMNDEKYEEAIAAFTIIGEYKDSSDKLKECYYNKASILEKDRKQYEAAVAFGAASGYKDAKQKSIDLWDKNAFRETVSASWYNTVGLKSDGTVIACGDNYYGQCDVGGWKDIVAVSAGRDHTVGLKSDGTVVATKYTGNKENYSGQCDVDVWTDIVAVSASQFHTVSLKSDGTVVACGSNGNGRCDVDEWTDIVAVSAGWYNTVGLKSDGTVVACGANDYGQCDVGDWKDIVAVSAGSLHTVGLKSDGTVVACGVNSNGECDVDEWMDIVAISAGASHTVGLKSDGTVVATKYTGDEDFYCGECDVDEWTDVVAVSTTYKHTVGLKSDGTVVTTKYTGNKDYYHGQFDVGGWKNIKTK